MLIALNDDSIFLSRRSLRQFSFLVSCDHNNFSPFLIHLLIFISLYHFWCKRTDFYKSSFAHFPSYWPENPCALWIVFFVDNHTAIVIKTQERSIRSTNITFRSDDNCSHDITFFDTALGICFFDGTNDDIANTRISTL